VGVQANDYTGLFSWLENTSVERDATIDDIRDYLVKKYRDKYPVAVIPSEGAVTGYDALLNGFALFFQPRSAAGFHVIGYFSAHAELNHQTVERMRESLRAVIDTTSHLGRLDSLIEKLETCMAYSEAQSGSVDAKVLGAEKISTPAKI
jgi:hypothetical protein